MLDESDNFTKHMFHYVPAMPFEVKDSMDITINGGTEWDHVTLQAGVMQHFWHDFVSDTGLVTDPGAKVFLDGNIRSSDELTALIDLNINKLSLLFFPLETATANIRAGA